MQRPPYVFMCESVKRFQLSYYTNHCVKLVKSPNLYWYWKGYSTKVMKENRISVSSVWRRTQQELEERLANSKEPDAQKKTEYQLGLGFFGKPHLTSLTKP